MSYRILNGNCLDLIPLIEEKVDLTGKNICLQTKK